MINKQYKVPNMMMLQWKLWYCIYSIYRVFHKNNPFDFFYYIFCQIVDKFYLKNYPVCTLENVLSSTIKTFAIKHEAKFTVHVWNVFHQLQCMLTVSCEIPWLHCQSLADQDCPTPPWRAGTALPRPWSGCWKCGSAESPHYIINWI